MKVKIERASDYGSPENPPCNGAFLENGSYYINMDWSHIPKLMDEVGSIIMAPAGKYSEYPEITIYDSYVE